MPELSHENAQFIDRIVSSDRFESRDAAIDEAICLLRSELQDSGQTPVDSMTPAEWCERFEKWAASHRSLPTEADDSRESIYSGRVNGEQPCQSNCRNR